MAQLCPHRVHSLSGDSDEKTDFSPGWYVLETRGPPEGGERLAWLVPSPAEVSHSTCRVFAEPKDVSE